MSQPTIIGRPDGSALTESKVKNRAYAEDRCAAVVD